MYKFDLLFHIICSMSHTVWVLLNSTHPSGLHNGQSTRHFGKKALYKRALHFFLPDRECCMQWQIFWCGSDPLVLNWHVELKYFWGWKGLALVRNWRVELTVFGGTYGESRRKLFEFIAFLTIILAFPKNVLSSAWSYLNFNLFVDFLKLWHFFVIAKRGRHTQRRWKNVQETVH